MHLALMIIFLDWELNWKNLETPFIPPLSGTIVFDYHVNEVGRYLDLSLCSSNDHGCFFSLGKIHWKHDILSRRYDSNNKYTLLGKMSHYLRCWRQRNMHILYFHEITMPDYIILDICLSCLISKRHLLIFSIKMFFFS